MMTDKTHPLNPYSFRYKDIGCQKSNTDDAQVAFVLHCQKQFFSVGKSAERPSFLCQGGGLIINALFKGA